MNSSVLIQGSLGDKAGANRQPIIIPNVFKPLNALNTNAEITAWTPAAGKKFRLMGFVLAAGTAGGAFEFRDNTAGTVIFTVFLATTESTVVELSNGILSAAANNVLTLTGPLTSTCTGTVWGCEE